MRFFIAMLVCLASVAEAQITELLPGSRLRLQSAIIPKQMDGTLMAHEGANLIIASSGALRTAVPHASIKQIRVSMGKSHGAGAIRGAKLGASIAGTLGLVLGWSAVSAGTFKSSLVIPFASQMAAGGAIWGLGIGAAIGAEKWKTVYQAPLQLDATR